MRAGSLRLPLHRSLDPRFGEKHLQAWHCSGRVNRWRLERADDWPDQIAGVTCLAYQAIEHHQSEILELVLRLHPKGNEDGVRRVAKGGQEMP